MFFFRSTCCMFLSRTVNNCMKSSIFCKKILILLDCIINSSSFGKNPPERSTLLMLISKSWTQRRQRWWRLHLPWSHAFLHDITIRHLLWWLWWGDAKDLHTVHSSHDFWKLVMNNLSSSCKKKKNLAAEFTKFNPDVLQCSCAMTHLCEYTINTCGLCTKLPQPHTSSCIEDKTGQQDLSVELGKKTGDEEERRESKDGVRRRRWRRRDGVACCPPILPRRLRKLLLSIFSNKR